MEKMDWLDVLANRGTTEFEESIMNTPQWTPFQNEVVRLSDVIAEKIFWLWYPYIARGKITLLEGDPGVGKSWVLLAIAIAVSLGRGLFGVDDFEPGRVLLFNSEDGLGDTIKHRLEKMGGDHTKIFAYKLPTVFNTEGLKKIEEVIAELRPTLVTIDPLVGYLGGDVDLHRANEIRQVMSALGAIATKYGCAIVALRHLTKGGKDKAIYRGIGSIDFVAACRSVLLAGCDPEDKAKRALVHIKSNLAPAGDAIGYAITDGEFQWTGPSDLTAAKIHSADPTADASAIDEAKDFIMNKLASGRAPSKEILEEAKERGISAKTFHRAKKTLGVQSEMEGKPGKKGAGVWYLRIVTSESDFQAHTAPSNATNQTRPPDSSVGTPTDFASKLDGQTSQAQAETNLIPENGAGDLTPNKAVEPSANPLPASGSLSEDDYDNI